MFVWDLNFPDKQIRSNKIFFIILTKKVKSKFTKHTDAVEVNIMDTFLNIFDLIVLIISLILILININKYNELHQKSIVLRQKLTLMREELDALVLEVNNFNSEENKETI